MSTVKFLVLDKTVTIYKDFGKVEFYFTKNYVELNSVRMSWVKFQKEVIRIAGYTTGLKIYEAAFLRAQR